MLRSFPAFVSVCVGVRALHVCVCACVRVCVCVCRIVNMVMTLREWAHKSLVEEVERPDSFLERFRGPAPNDIQAPPSRFSHTHADSDADAEGRRMRRM